MPNTMTNFTAADMPGGSGSGSKRRSAAKKRAPRQQEEPKQPEPQAPQPPPQEPEDSGVPRGSTDEVLGWVGDDKDRANRALTVESQEERPRKRLTAELEQILSS